LKIFINGNEVAAGKNDTILEVSRKYGIYIPTLCNHDDLSPVGSCRICVVEIKNTGNLIPACSSPVQSLMNIETDSSRVLQTRRTNLKLLLANHADNCLVCDAANLCELRKLAAELGVANSFFVKSRTALMVDQCHPSIQRDLSKCILCRRCVRACREIVGKDMWAVAFRGHNSRIVLRDDAELDMEGCHDCTVCADVCPVGALINTSKGRAEKKPCKFEVNIA